jgi:hypothetical protein
MNSQKDHLKELLSLPPIARKEYSRSRSPHKSHSHHAHHKRSQSDERKLSDNLRHHHRHHRDEKH